MSCVADGGQRGVGQTNKVGQFATAFFHVAKREERPAPFFSRCLRDTSATACAYRSVFRERSWARSPKNATLPIITVRHPSAKRYCFSIRVNACPRNGTCRVFLSNPRTHCFNASRDALISRLSVNILSSAVRPVWWHFDHPTRVPLRLDR